MRRISIFRTFKGYTDPGADAGYIHKDFMGVSLLDACKFDRRDALVLEDQLRQFKGGSYSGGSS